MKRDRLERDSVNVMKNRLLVTKNTRKSEFKSTWLSRVSKSWKLSLGTNNTQNVRKSY